jgi:hypothetical protein
MGYRRATPVELGYNGDPLKLATDFKDALAQGHVIHGYSSGGSVRLLMVLASREYSDTAPLLGFGDGENTEVALRRARDTYRRRVAEGLGHITESQYPEALSGLVTGGHTTSPLDSIVWGGSLKIYQEGSDVVAWSAYSKYGGSPVEGRGADAQAAVDDLIPRWQS